MNNAGLHIAVFVKEIPVSVNYIRCHRILFHIISRAIVVSRTVFISNPNTALDNAIDEIEGHAIGCRNRAICSFKCIRHEVALYTVNILPSALIYTFNSVIEFTILTVYSAIGRKIDGSAAFTASQSIRITAVNIFMLCADCFFLGVSIKFFAGQLFAVNRNFAFICLYKQVNGVVITNHSIKVKLRRISHAVSFLTRGTADKVNNAVFLIDLTISHRQCACIRMVMSGKHKVDTGLFRCGRQHIMNFIVAAGCIRVVCRLMYREDFPCCI